MGINDLTKLVEDSPELSIVVSSLAGLVLAWDISCLLHIAISSRKGADQYHAAPPAPVTAVRDATDKVIGLFKPFDITLIAVFGGVQHPIKGRVTEKRIADSSARMDKLRALWAKGDIDDYAGVQRLKKGC